MEERRRSDDEWISAKDRTIYVTIALAIILLTALLVLVLF